MDERLIESLAQKMYEAHMEWRARLSEVNQAWTRWFALAPEYRRPYLAAAKVCDEEAEKRKPGGAKT